MASASNPRKRKDLNLKEQVEIIEKLKNSTQMAIANEYHVSQSQISRISKNSESILKKWRENDNLDKKRQRTGKHTSIDEILFEWYKKEHARNTPIDGPMLQAKAREIANELGIQLAENLNSWLTRWKNRFNLVWKKRAGEQNDADTAAAENWIKNVLPTLIKDYQPRNVFNADETGLWFRALPDGTFCFRGEAATGSKKAKERLSILFCANSDGSEKLKPLVIGKSKNPRCFKQAGHLPVDYDANANAWMTMEIFEKWLVGFDKSMRKKKRNIILFLDNASSHKFDVRLTNIRLEFLPPNTTSKIQPMDMGVIRTFKAYYRARMMQKVLAILSQDPNATASITAKKLSILDALYLIASSWNSMRDEVIQNCFRKAGFIIQDDINEEDMPLSSFILPRPSNMTEEEFDQFIDLDNELATGEPIELSDILPEASSGAIELSDSDDADEEAIQTLPPPSMKDALAAIDTLKRFFSDHDQADLSGLYHVEQEILNQVAPTIQSKITDYFS